MKISSLAKSIPTWIAGLSLVTGVGVTTAMSITSARADDPGNYVSFGDSLAANPNMIQIMAGHNPALAGVFKTPPVPDGYCATGEDNFANRVAHDTGSSVHNYACSGAPGALPHPFNFQSQVDHAERDHSLTSDTRLVTIIFGMNDTYQDPDVAKTPEQREATFLQGMSSQIARVHSLAPNAKVVVVGYPDLTDGKSNLCPINFAGNVSRVHVDGLDQTQANVRESQRKLAQDNEAIFLDMSASINAQNNNNSCGTGERLAAADIDEQAHNLWGHLTAAGNQYYADRIKEIL